MEYTWTKSYVNDLALANRKLDNDTLYQVCNVEASYNKEQAVLLYNMVKEAIVVNKRYR